jgi:tetratricopeptide (TPR) repeat protein
MNIKRVILLVALVLWVCLTVTDAQNVDIQVHRNRGKAYYERGEYALAVQELVKLLEMDGATARDSVNAGLALLQDLDQDGALGAFTTAKQMDPDMIEVDFGLAVLYKRQLRHPLALESFQRVVARDPEDTCSWFNIGVVQASLQNRDEALRAFERVLAMGYPVAQNFYVSALFRKAALVSQQGRRDEARPLLEEFKLLRAKLPNVSFTASALENGKYGQVEVPVSVGTATVARGATPVFAELGRVQFSDSRCKEEPSLALGDYDADEAVDVFVTNPCGQNRLFRNQGNGRFVDVTSEVGLEASKQGLGALFVDYDNSGFVSLVVLGRNANRIYYNQEGKFLDVTETTGLAGGSDAASSSVLSFDFDNDGQLDLFLSGAAGLKLYRNNGDGSFEDISAGAGFPIERSRGAGFADFNEDGFTDLLLVKEGAEAVVLSNAGNGEFRPASVTFNGSPAGRLAARVSVGDFNHDGWFDAFVVDEKSVTVLLNRQGRLESVSPSEALAPHSERWAVALDADANGRIDVLLREEEGRFHLLTYKGDGDFEEGPIELPDSATGYAVWTDLDGEGATDLIAAGGDGILRFFRRKSPARAPWLSVALQGRRSNRQAMGAILEIKTGLFYQKHLIQGLPLTVYPSGRSEVDVVRITWSNGVVQNEVGVAADERLAIEEEERMTSSCPFVYIWDGGRFRFLSDFLGRAPVGEPLPGGGELTPNPEDYVRIAPEAMKPSNGGFVFQITEELKEIAYLDAVELLAIDHPEGEEIYTNERFSSPPFEPFRLYTVSEKRSPVRATNHRGEDILQQLLEADGRYVDAGSLHRIPGLAEEHAMILDPGPLASGQPLKLFLTGWVYWASSSSMRALSNHRGVSLHPPELQVKDGQGRWVTVIEDLGLPSGTNRTLVVDLADKYLSADRSVRIRTNLRVYWDHAFFAAADIAAPEVKVLKPREADLHYRGFSTPFRTGGRETPHLFDYTKMLTVAPWNAPDGLYTRFGEARALVEEVDNRLVVMAPGDELTVVFDADALAPPPAGWRRDFFLHFSGWAKDNDPNTTYFQTVEPLPFWGMETYFRATSWRSQVPADYLESYQTRQVPLLIAPLAPPR